MSSSAPASTCPRCAETPCLLLRAPAPTACRATLAGDGRIAGAASSKPLLPHRPPQCALLRRARDVVVRRRHGSHALLRLRRGRAPLPPLVQGGAGAVRQRLLPEVQAVV